MEFVTLYAREAHPGDRFPQAASLEQKREYAREYQQRDQIPWTVAVDDVDGRLHSVLDPKPNAAYIMGTDGDVAYRALWSNDERTLRRALRTLVERGGVIGQTQSRVVPMLSGMGRMYEMLLESGPTAQRDVLRHAPPLYGMARLAALYRPLPPLARGVAALATVALAALAARSVFKRSRALSY